MADMMESAVLQYTPFFKQPAYRMHKMLPCPRLIAAMHHQAGSAPRPSSGSAAACASCCSSCDAPELVPERLLRAAPRNCMASTCGKKSAKGQVQQARRAANSVALQCIMGSRAQTTWNK